jgi:hypothetical protein
MRNHPSPHQGDLFSRPVFEARIAASSIDYDRFRLRMKAALSLALDGRDRAAVAGELSAQPGLGPVSRAMLDHWCAPSKPHDIPLTKFKALARLTGAAGLWDVAVGEDGLLVLRGDEARLAEIARLEQQKRHLARKLTELRALPVLLQRGER